jgi:general nucleoside transport system permease protein
MRRLRHTLVTSVVPAVIAVIVALVVLAIVLVVLRVDPVKALTALFDFGDSRRAEANQLRVWVNRTVPLFLAGLAVSIGFRMNLFNIGVEGQYAIAAAVSAGVGGILVVPAPFGILVILLVAMATGAAYAAVPAVLKVTRGVNEVITTIMLNSIAVGIIAYLLRGPFRDPQLASDANNATRQLPQSSWFPSIANPFGWLGMDTPSRPVGGFLVVAVLVGVLVWFLLERTRFGFSLRSAGRNSSAAEVGGVPARRLTVQAMLLSGAIAGLIGMPQILGETHNFGIDFVYGFGFSGIAVALLGRNNPVGIALAAILFAFLDRSGPSLQNVDIPPSVTVITQGVIVLAVVIVNELARRRLLRAEERAVGRRTAGPAPPATAVTTEARA